MRLNLQLFKGGVKSGSGAETVNQGNGSDMARFNEAIDRYASEWDVMGQVDMGTSVNPVVQEMRDIIQTVRDFYGTENGSLDAGSFGHTWEFHTPQVRDAAYSFVNTTQDSGRGMNLMMGIVSPKMTITPKGLAGFLEYMHTDLHWDEYAQFARDELARNQPKGRGRKR